MEYVMDPEKYKDTSVSESGQTSKHKSKMMQLTERLGMFKQNAFEDELHFDINNSNIPDQFKSGIPKGQMFIISGHSSNHKDLINSLMKLGSKYRIVLEKDFHVIIEKDCPEEIRKLLLIDKQSIDNVTVLDSLSAINNFDEQPTCLADEPRM